MSSAWPGCARWWSGNATFPIPASFFPPSRSIFIPEEVYTFTPKGKVVVLPRDSSPIDFAYSVHTEVGHSCVGAKVNGRMVPLRFKLHSGDIVEILTQTGHKPSRDWLGYRQVVARPQQDQALAQRSPARARDRNRPQADRERSAQVPHLAERHQGRRVAEDCLRLRRGPCRRPDGRHRLRQIFGAPDPGTPGACSQRRLSPRKNQRNPAAWPA